MLKKLTCLCYLMVAVLFTAKVDAQSTVFNTPLAGCGPSGDTIIYQSDWVGRGHDWWKPVDFGFVSPTGTRGGFEFGVPTNVAANATANNPAQGTDLCVFQNGTVVTSPFPWPTLNGVDTIWDTNLDGCYDQINGQDSTRLYKVFDFSALSAPIQFTFQSWWSGTNGDNAYLKINERVMWNNNQPGANRPWTDRTWTNDPFINSLAGTTGVTIEFGMRSVGVWTERGLMISNIGIRGCKDDGGFSGVPTLSDWSLIFLGLLFINISLLLKKNPSLVPIEDSGNS